MPKAPQNTTGNCPTGSLHVSSYFSTEPPPPLLSSGGWRLSVGHFSPLYKCQSWSSVSKVSQVSSSQAKLNHSAQSSPWRSSSHTSSTNTQILMPLCRIHTMSASLENNSCNKAKMRGSGIWRKGICLMAFKKYYWRKMDAFKTWIKAKRLNYVFSTNIICASLQRKRPLNKRPNWETKAIKVGAKVVTQPRVPINSYCSGGYVLQSQYRKATLHSLRSEHTYFSSMPASCHLEVTQTKEINEHSGKLT